MFKTQTQSKGSTGEKKVSPLLVEHVESGKRLFIYAVIKRRTSRSNYGKISGVQLEIVAGEEFKILRNSPIANTTKAKEVYAIDNSEGDINIARKVKNFKVFTELPIYFQEEDEVHYCRLPNRTRNKPVHRSTVTEALEDFKAYTLDMLAKTNAALEAAESL